MKKEEIERLYERMCKLKNDAEEVRKDLVAYLFETGSAKDFPDAVRKSVWMVQFIDRIDYTLREEEEKE